MFVSGFSFLGSLGVALNHENAKPETLTGVSFATRYPAVGSQAIHDTLNIFFVDVRTHNTAKILEALIFSGLNSGKDLSAIHHVRLEVDNWAFIESVRE